jgi:hypothetical protein
MLSREGLFTGKRSAFGKETTGFELRSAHEKCG